MSAVDELFAGPGVARANARALDWAATPLGPVERWPQSLETAVDGCLAIQFPTLLLWGSDLTCIHNEEHVPFWAPASTGRWDKRDRRY